MQIEQTKHGNVIKLPVIGSRLSLCELYGLGGGGVGGIKSKANNRGFINYRNDSVINTIVVEFQLQRKMLVQFTKLIVIVPLPSTLNR